MKRISVILSVVLLFISLVGYYSMNFVKASKPSVETVVALKGKECVLVNNYQGVNTYEPYLKSKDNIYFFFNNVHS